MTHWWQDLFDEKYLRMFAEARPPMQTEQEVEALLALLEQHCGAPADVLDLACGYGRVSLPLAQAGHRMTGFDLSAFLLDAAKTAARQAGATVTWQEGDMRTLPADWTAEFDAVLNMFSAFGYFDDAEDNQQVLAEVARVLRPGGVFILDLAQRDAVVHNFRPTDWFEVDDLLVCVSRQFDAITGTSTEYWLWSDEQGERLSLYFRVHLYTATDLTRMLQAVGLEPLAYYGNLAIPLEDNPFEPFGSRLVIVAKKL